MGLEPRALSPEQQPFKEFLPQTVPDRGATVAPLLLLRPPRSGSPTPARDNTQAVASGFCCRNRLSPFYKNISQRITASPPPSSNQLVLRGPHSPKLLKDNPPCIAMVT
ncbi:hypothetical protein GN956_G12309 [Arapaima gigas]